MRAGCARASITPPLGIPLAGFAARTTGAQGVHDDLFARAVVLEEDTTRLALVVCDLCEMDETFVARVRRQIEAASGIPAHAVMVAATHTHAAPATFPLYSLPPDPGWLDVLADRVTVTVVAALHNLAPAVISVGVGHEATVGRNRRRPDAPADPVLTVVRLDRQGAAPAILVHYACHPTVLGPDNLLISRDYVGFTVDAVERAADGFALFTNGACGDINAGHSADRSALGLPLPGRTFDRAEALGLRLAIEAIRSLGDTRPAMQAGARPGHLLAAGQRTIEVPLRQTPSLDEARENVRTARARLEASGSSGEDLTSARLELMYAELALSWVEQRGSASTETAEVQGLAAGDLALVALPGEFFAESGQRLRARSPFPHTLVVGYANGGIGYVPPAAAFADGGYETRLAPWSRVAPEAEAMILDAAEALLRGLRREQGAA